jgi:hypothetical protein
VSETLICILPAGDGQQRSESKHLSFGETPLPVTVAQRRDRSSQSAKSLNHAEGFGRCHSPLTRRNTAPSTTKKLFETPIHQLSSNSRKERQFRLSRSTKVVEFEERSNEASLRHQVSATALNLQRQHGMLADVARRERRRLRGNPLRPAPEGLPLDFSRNECGSPLRSSGSGESFASTKEQQSPTAGVSPLQDQEEVHLWSPLQGNTSIRVLNTKKLSQRRAKKDELGEGSLMNGGSLRNSTNMEPLDKSLNERPDFAQAPKGLGSPL